MQMSEEKYSGWPADCRTPEHARARAILATEDAAVKLEEAIELLDKCDRALANARLKNTKTRSRLAQVLLEAKAVLREIGEQDPNATPVPLVAPVDPVVIPRAGPVPRILTPLSLPAPPSARFEEDDVEPSTKPRWSKP